MSNRTLLSLVKSMFHLYDKYDPVFMFLRFSNRERPLDLYLHQAEILARLQLRVPVRALIADEIGLGKTISSLVLVRRLQEMDLVQKVLIIVPRILVSQWIEELSRTGVDVKKIRRIERWSIDELSRSNYPPGFYLVSLDTLKSDRAPYNYLSKTLQVDWDFIIVDEAHRLSTGTDRFVVGNEFVRNKPMRNVLFLSATPHKGDPEDYLARMRMLDPYLSEEGLNTTEFFGLTHNTLVFRRTKEDINKTYEQREVFPKSDFNAIVIPTSDEERDFQGRLMKFLRRKILEYNERTGNGSRAIGLLTAIVFKRSTSSPFAATRTLLRMIEKRAIEDPKKLDQSADSVAASIFGYGFEDYEDYLGDSVQDIDEAVNDFVRNCASLLEASDEDEIRSLMKLADSIRNDGDSKLNSITKLIEGVIHNSTEKIIIFTEYKDTMNYVFDWLATQFGKEYVLKLSADEARDSEQFRKIRDKFQRNEKARILVATDVASEGLNLQVANVLINYEIPWSVVKLEQRIGRVWRLGQKREVRIYTMFLSAKIDSDALQIIYSKLLNMREALGQTKPIIGEQMFIANPSDWRQLTEVPLIEVESNKKKVRLSEEAFISAYLRSEEDLLELVSSIMNTLAALNLELKRTGVFPKVEREMVLRLMERGSGFSTFADLSESLWKLLVVLSHAFPELPLKVTKNAELNEVSVQGGFPLKNPSPSTVYSLIKKVILADAEDSIPNYVVAYGPNSEILYIIEARIIDKQSGRTLYSEPIGVLITEDVTTPEKRPISTKILRGQKLLDYISNAAENVATTSKETMVSVAPDVAKAAIRNEFSQSVFDLSKSFSDYCQKLSKRGWRSANYSWQPNLNGIEVSVGILLGVVHRMLIDTTRIAPPSQRTRDEIDRKAMKFVLDYEEKHGRMPNDVSQDKHFDVESCDSKTNEIRFIEVKGHSGFTIYGELTEPEYAEAQRLGPNYWLYIIYNIDSGSPVPILVRDPLKNMKVTERNEKRFVLTP